MGFLSFLGVVLACPSCFLGLLGFSVFLVVLLLLLGWGGGLRGVPGFGVGAPGCLASFLLGGRVWGASARARFLSCLVLAVVGVGGRVRGVRVARFPWWGSGCARFLLLLVVVGVFGCCFFPSGASCVFWFCGAWSFVGLWFPRGRGVVGGVGLGWGCFFSGFCCTGPGLFPVSFVGAGLGLGWVLFGEFDPGSGRTLAACLTHASRTGPPLWGWVEWRTGEYHVSNLPPAPG